MKKFNERCNAKNAVVFKKWGRRNYSLFSILKRVVHISVLSVAYFIAVPKVVLAVTQDTSEVKMQFDIEAVEVTASRVPVLFSQLARVLTVIESAEIERMPAESIQDLLEYVAGVDIRQRGAEGVQSDISIRGGTFDQILILLNGINITDPQTGHHNLNLPVSLSQIKRIEILNGPAARVYGPNSFSGAINIITHKPQTESLSAQLSAGSFGYLNSEASGSVRTGNFGHSLSGGYKKSDGYTINTDFKSTNVFYTGELSGGAGNLVLQGGYSDKSFGANSFYTPVYPNQFEEVKSIIGSARFESSTKLNLTPSLYWRRHSDVFMLFRNNAPDWYANHNYHKTDVWGADLNSWFIWAAGKTAFGAGFRSESILSNVLGEPLENRVKIKGVDAYYSHSKKRNIGSVYADHSLILNKFTITGGLMANLISDYDEGINVFPGIDAGYQIHNHLKIIGSWNTSLRMPTFTDLYYSGPTNLGNPELKPEQSSSIEGGLKLIADQANGHLVYFRRKGKNLIDWIKYSVDDDVWLSINHTELNSEGVDFHLNWNFQNLSSNWLPEKVEAGYVFNHQTKGESSFISYYVLDNLRHKFTGSLSYKLTDRLDLDLISIFQDREGSFSFYDGTGYTGEREYKPFWLFDAKASYQLSNINFYVSVNNIFDQQYYDIGNVVQPGRWLKAGASFKLTGAK